MSMRCFEIKQIPDLTLSKYRSLSSVGIMGVLEQHKKFLRIWHGISKESNTNFHLLYVFLPSEIHGKRLKLYFILQGDEKNLITIEPLLKSISLSEYFKFETTALPPIRFEAAATLTKKERIIDVLNPLTNQEVTIHYVPKWEVNEKARLYELFKMMEAISQSSSLTSPCAFRVDLYASSEIEKTNKKFKPILKLLRGENDITVLNNFVSLKDNDNVKEICKEYDSWLTCIETTPHFRMNVYAFAESLFKAKVILNTVGSESLNLGDFSITQIKPDSDGMYSLLSRMKNNAIDYSFYSSTEAVLKSWSTTFSLQEVEPFFRFPTLFEGETIEIPKETSPVQITDGVFLGKDIYNHPVYFPLKDLSKHAFFTGMPGSGKTNTMLHVITELKKKNVKFLILEPSKKEYRFLLGLQNMQDVYLFSPHLRSYFPLQMNPFEFPKGVRLSDHINALLEVFKGSFYLEGATYKYLSNAIERSYVELRWDIEDIYTETCSLEFPTLQNVYENLEQEIDGCGYDANMKGNILTFLQVRLGSLMERDAGEIFNSPISTISPEEWINISAIVELEILEEQVKNFFVLLVTHYIYETLRIYSKDRDNKCIQLRHSIFIEEAHNIISPTSQQVDMDTVNPKISATAYIMKMLAEVRALHEAIIIADQLPSALASEVTKNTGLKIVHRLNAKDDREEICTTISASPNQFEQIASLTPGKALIYHEKTKKPFEIQIEEWKAPNISFNISNDEELFSYIKKNEVIIRPIIVSLKNIKKSLFLLNKKFFELKKNSREMSRDDFSNKYIYDADKDLIKMACLTLKKKCDCLKKMWSIKDDSVNNEFNEINSWIEQLLFSLENLVIGED